MAPLCEWSCHGRLIRAANISLWKGTLGTTTVWWYQNWHAQKRKENYQPLCGSHWPQTAVSHQHFLYWVSPEWTRLCRVWPDDYLMQPLYVGWDPKSTGMQGATLSLLCMHVEVLVLGVSVNFLKWIVKTMYLERIVLPKHTHTILNGGATYMHIIYVQLFNTTQSTSV